MSIVYCLAKYLHGQHLFPSQCVSLFMLFLNCFNRQHYLSPDEVTHLVHLSPFLIGPVFKLPSFPLLFKQMIEPEPKRHASTFQTHPVGSLTYYKAAINTILQLALLCSYLQILQYFWQWLQNQRIAICISKTLLQPYSKARERTQQCVNRASYIVVNFVNHVGRKAAKIMCWLSIVFNEGKVLSIIKDLGLYKQLTISCYRQSDISVSYSKREFRGVA